MLLDLLKHHLLHLHRAQVLGALHSAVEFLALDKCLNSFLEEPHGFEELGGCFIPLDYQESLS